MWHMEQNILVRENITTNQVKDMEHTVGHFDMYLIVLNILILGNFLMFCSKFEAFKV